MKKHILLISIGLIASMAVAQNIKDENNTATPIYHLNGKVGIGTNNPVTKLNVVDNNASLPILGTSSNSQFRIVSGNNCLEIGVTNVWNARVAGLQVRHDNDGYANYFGNLLLNPLGGNIGIGTTNPVQKLEIKEGTLYLNSPSIDGGTIRSYGHYLDFKGSADNAYAHRVYRFYPATGSSGTTNTALQLFRGGTDGSFSSAVYISSNNYSYFNGGNVGIGTTNPQSLLTVNGTITSKEVNVTMEGWSDFVFSPTYTLISLEDLEQYINQHKHLPDVPSEKEVKENGLSLGQSDAVLLQKIEELTLYLIEQNKKTKKQSEKIKVLEEAKIETEKEIERLKKVEEKYNAQQSTLIELIKRIEKLESNK